MSDSSFCFASKGSGSATKIHHDQLQDGELIEVYVTENGELRRVDSSPVDPGTSLLRSDSSQQTAFPEHLVNVNCHNPSPVPAICPSEGSPPYQHQTVSKILTLLKTFSSQPV